MSPYGHFGAIARQVTALNSAVHAFRTMKVSLSALALFPVPRKGTTHTDHRMCQLACDAGHIGSGGRGG